MEVQHSTVAKQGETLVKECLYSNNDIRIFRGENYLRAIIAQMPGYEKKVGFEKDTLIDDLDFTDLIADAQQLIKIHRVSQNI